MFYGEEFLAPRPTPKLEDHPLSAVGDCLFNTFAATLRIGGRSSTRNLRTRHTVRDQYCKGLLQVSQPACANNIEVYSSFYEVLFTTVKCWRKITAIFRDV